VADGTPRANNPDSVEAVEKAACNEHSDSPPAASVPFDCGTDRQDGAGQDCHPRLCYGATSMAIVNVGRDTV